MNYRNARRLVLSYGCTIARRPDGEYRVNYSGGVEATAYYTNDLHDAVDTAQSMWRLALAREGRSHDAAA